MQTILGAGGAIGTDLAKELTSYTTSIRLVSRNPKKVNPADELFPADLTQREAVDKAVAGSKVVYLTAGLVYKAKVWQKQWPVLMRNVIGACKKHGARLVFFDNMYLYDSEHMHHMTEETPVRPESKKGQVREQLANMIWEEVKQGQLTALIARAADFISLSNSVLVEMVAKNLLKGKKANWLADAAKVHTFTYAPDAARATALLGNTPDAFNQVWHLPTDTTPRTGKQWVELIAQETGTTPRYSVLPKGMMGVLGLFVPVLKEFREMAYQWDRDYVFDSSKIEKQFGLKPTPAPEAIRELVAQLKK